MEPAARAMEQALAEADVRPPVVPVYANVTPRRRGSCGDPPAAGRAGDRNGALARKRRCDGEAGVTHFVEFGGKVLSPMVKRIAPDAKTTSVISMDDIEALAKEI
jgi:[acyl-carrier-protein] S-malonyltransferase